MKNDMRTLINLVENFDKKCINESDLGSVYSAYSQGNEPEYPSKIEDLLDTLESKGFYENLSKIASKRQQSLDTISNLLDPTFSEFDHLALKLKKNKTFNSASEAEEFIKSLLHNKFANILSDSNKALVIKKFLKYAF